MARTLPYKIECKSSYPFFELIAAFDCEPVALGYASQCQTANPGFTYRVKRGSKVLREFEAATRIVEQ